MFKIKIILNLTTQKIIIMNIYIFFYFNLNLKRILRSRTEVSYFLILLREYKLGNRFQALSHNYRITIANIKNIVQDQDKIIFQNCPASQPAGSFQNNVYYENAKSLAR